MLLELRVLCGVGVAVDELCVCVCLRNDERSVEVMK